MRLLLAVAFAATVACGDGSDDGPPVPSKDLCGEELVTITPSGLAFGRLIPGTSRVRTATLTYQGCEPASLTLTTDGLLSPECSRGAFCLERPPKLELQPDESVPIKLRFQPANTGVALGALIVSGCPTSRCRGEVLLQGSSQVTGIVCHPSPLDMGVVAVGHCASRRVDCTNVIDRSVRIERLNLLDATSGELSVVGDVPVDLAPDKSAGMDVGYCPRDEEADQATLIVVSSVAGRTSSVAVALAARSGGGRIGLPESVDFGRVSLIAPARRPFRVSNGGSHRLEVFGVAAEPPFSVVLASGASLPPGGSAHLWLQVEPTREGRIERTIELYSDDPTAPVRTLQAVVEGVNLPPCNVTLSEEMLDFGAIQVGDVAARDLTVSNESPLDCFVTAASLVEVDAPFDVTDARSMRIESGSSASISVKFAPTSTSAAASATLEIGVSSPDEPFRRVRLIGRGQ